jgi:hypothetical protein
MPTATQTFTDRATAIADVATKLAALKTSWVAARSYDIACQSKVVLALHPTGATKSGSVRSFGQPSTWVPDCLVHPDGVAAEYMCDWERLAQAAALTLVANVTAG